MSPFLILSVLIGYSLLLILLSFITSRNTSTLAFFVANRQAPWYAVAFGMIGATLSGVTFISVPGAILHSQFSYLQVVFGYLLGYFVIATVLLPLYYRLQLISIYTYLEQRFGFWSYQTGAAFFLLSRTMGAAFQMFVPATVLHLGLFGAWGIPFWVTAVVSILLIWGYSFRGGIQTIVWTDVLQSALTLLAVVVTFLTIKHQLALTYPQLLTTIIDSPYSQIFFWEGQDTRNFFKQLLAGAFIAIVMTGLDQNMMQKNLSCRNLKEAQQNILLFSLLLLVVNLLFLGLGVLLYTYAHTKGIELPKRTDELYPLLAFNYLGTATGIAFLVGLIAITYSGVDSALTALTTSFCVDFLKVSQRSEEERRRLVRKVHIGFSVGLVLVIIWFQSLDDTAVINKLLKAVGFTYGPLLGLYAFGLFTQFSVRDRWVPLVCVIAPLLCFILNENSKIWWGYEFGFEILLVNGLLTFLGLLLLLERRANGT